MQTHLAVSTLPGPAAGLAAPHFLDPTACFLRPVAGLVVVGESHRMLAVAHVDSAVELFGSDPVEAVSRIHSRRCARHAAVSAPICLVGRNIRHSTARNHPGHGHSHSIVGRTGCRSPRAVAAVRAEGVLGRSIAAAATGGSRRIAVAGMPWRRYRMFKPQTRPMVR